MINEQTAGYEQMVEEIKEDIGFDEYPGVVAEVVEYGADAGFGSFIYYSDTSKFYERHQRQIEGMLITAAEEFGYETVEEFMETFGRSDMLRDETTAECLKVWYALETVCRDLVNQGAHIPECDECCAILEDDGSCADCDAEEEEEEEEEDTPDDDDYVMSDSGYLGSKTTVSVGRTSKEFDSTSKAWDWIEWQMSNEQYYPNVWYVTDHGNVLGPMTRD